MIFCDCFFLGNRECYIGNYICIMIYKFYDVRFIVIIIIYFKYISCICIYKIGIDICYLLDKKNFRYSIILLYLW